MRSRWRRLPLRLLPRAFRDRFGADLLDAIAVLHARAAGMGRRRRWTYLLRETAALLHLAISLRRRPASGGPGRGRRSVRFVEELRWAARFARRRPAFSAAVVATLALTVGSAGTAFALADAVLWRALPFEDAERLVFLWERPGDDAPRASRVTASTIARWREADNGLAAVAMFGAAGFTVETADGAEALRGVRVSAGYFQVLGVSAALGRTFAPEDETPGRHRVVILSHRLWRDRFGGRRDVIGMPLRMNGEPYAIVGVMPALTFPAWPVNPATVTLDADARDFWVPVPRTPALDQNARAHVFGVIGRLAPGLSVADVEARLDSTAGGDAVDRHRSRVVPLRAQLTGTTRAPLIALGLATLAVLFIACANLAALYASLFESRRAELAVRQALGAGSGRLVRQLLFETSLLTLAGAGAGLAAATIAIRWLPGAIPASVPLLTTPSLDWRVALFCAALAAVATFALAAWPVMRVWRSAPAPRGVAPRPRAAVYRALVVGQVAAALVLTAAAGLLARSLDLIRAQPAGFAIEPILVGEVGLSPLDTTTAEGTTGAERRVLDVARAVPRVRSAAIAYDHPLEANWSEAPLVVGSTEADDRRTEVELRIVSPEYFDTLGVELLEGRVFGERDAIGAAGVAIVNEVFAREIGGRALGRRIRTSTPRFQFETAPGEFEVVGIVGNERMRGLEAAARPALYLSTRQFPQSSFSLLARVEGDPLDAAPGLRAAVRQAGAGVTFDRATTLDRVLDQQLAVREVTTTLIEGLARASLVLASLGIYGLLAIVIASRTREIGVRLAIGATPGSELRRVVHDSLRNVALGVALGTVAALVTGRLLESLLFDVSPYDPWNLAVAAGTLIVMTLVASALPARRAARVDPVNVLRAH